MRAIAPLLLLLAPLTACDFPSLTYAGAGGGGSGGGADDGGAGGAPCVPPADTSGCDKDGDGWPAMRCCGQDCDDTDPRARPDQTEFFDVPVESAGGYDFDCDGVATKNPEQLFPPPLTCGELDECAAKEGYGPDSKCGNNLDFRVCLLEPTKLTCTPQPQTGVEPLRCH